MSIQSLKEAAEAQKAICREIYGRTSASDPEYIAARRVYNRLINRLHKASHPEQEGGKVVVIKLSPEQLKAKLDQIQAEKIAKYGSAEKIPVGFFGEVLNANNL